MMQGNDNLVGIAAIDMLHPTCPSPKSLATLSERDELQGIAGFRDKNKNGMTRKEMILLGFFYETRQFALARNFFCK